jgi:hypothetical protein
MARELFELQNKFRESKEAEEAKRRDICIP